MKTGFGYIHNNDKSLILLDDDQDERSHTFDTQRPWLLQPGVSCEHTLPNHELVELHATKECGHHVQHQQLIKSANQPLICCRFNGRAVSDVRHSSHPPTEQQRESIPTQYTMQELKNLGTHPYLIPQHCTP